MTTSTLETRLGSSNVTSTTVRLVGHEHEREPSDADPWVEVDSAAVRELTVELVERHPGRDRAGRVDLQDVLGEDSLALDLGLDRDPVLGPAVRLLDERDLWMTRTRRVRPTPGRRERRRRGSRPPARPAHGR